MVAHNTPALIKETDTNGAVGSLDPWFVTGLVEGEGCFCISLAPRAKLRTGVEIRPSFALSLNEKDERLVRDLRAFFGCGSIRWSKGDRTFKYEVRSAGDLIDVIVPHFERFALQGAKREAFTGFRTVCRMVEQGDHLTRSGVRVIVDIAYEMNLGKRPRSRDELLKVLDEVKG